MIKEKAHHLVLEIQKLNRNEPDRNACTMEVSASPHVPQYQSVSFAVLSTITTQL